LKHGTHLNRAELESLVTIDFVTSGEVDPDGITLHIHEGAKNKPMHAIILGPHTDYLPVLGPVPIAAQDSVRVLQPAPHKAFKQAGRVVIRLPDALPVGGGIHPHEHAVPVAHYGSPSRELCYGWGREVIAKDGPEGQEPAR
jgi:hypothetical protein